MQHGGLCKISVFCTELVSHRSNLHIFFLLSFSANGFPSENEVLISSYYLLYDITTCFMTSWWHSKDIMTGILFGGNVFEGNGFGTPCSKACKKHPETAWKPSKACALFCKLLQACHCQRFCSSLVFFNVHVEKYWYVRTRACVCQKWAQLISCNTLTQLSMHPFPYGHK